MRTLPFALFLAACSNAANPTPDAYLAPLDVAGDGGAVAVDGSMQPPTGGANVLIINEVCAGDTPDWFEIVNATFEPIQLDQFAYIDSGGVAMAKPFPTMMLAPGAYYVQDVDDTVSGFKLGSDEAVSIYRVSDSTLVSHVDWADGAAPGGMSYGRTPTIFGAFATGAQSKGTANP